MKLGKLNKEQKKLLVKHLNKNFGSEEAKKLLEQYKTKLTGQNGLRKKLGEIDSVYFGKAYFPKYFSRESPEFHSEIEEHLDQMVDGKIMNLCVIAPRGFSKSTLCSYKIPLRFVLYRIKPFILLVSASEDMAEEFLKAIRKELEDNEAVIEDFGELKGSVWRSDKLELANNTCIQVKGADSTLRGIKYGEMRPYLVLSDDIMKDSNVSSESKLQSLKNFYNESLGNIGDTYTSYLIVGTRMLENDLLADVMTNPTYTTLEYQAVKSFATHEDLWLEWKEIVNRLENPYRLSEAETFFEKNKEKMLEGTDVLWKEKMDYYDLMLKRVEIGDAAFEKELQNNVHFGENRIFNKLEFHENLKLNKMTEIVLTIDPSLAKTNRSDFAAITVLGKDEDGYFYVIEGDCRRLKPDVLIDEVITKLNMFPTIKRIGVETVNFQALLMEQLRKALMKNNIHVDITEINSRSNKHERIIAMQPIINNGYVKFNKSNTMYNEQILKYEPGKKDDSPDSLEMAISLLKQNKRIGTLNKKALGL